MSKLGHWLVQTWRREFCYQGEAHMNLEPPSRRLFDRMKDGTWQPRGPSRPPRCVFCGQECIGAIDSGSDAAHSLCAHMAGQGHNFHP